MKKKRAFYAGDFNLFSVKHLAIALEALCIYDELVIAVPKRCKDNLSRIQSIIEEFVSMHDFKELIHKDFSLRENTAVKQIKKHQHCILYRVFDGNHYDGAKQYVADIVLHDDDECWVNITSEAINNLMQIGEYVVLMQYLVPCEHNYISREYLSLVYDELTNKKNYGYNIIDRYLRYCSYHNYSHVAYCLKMLQEFVAVNPDTSFDVKGVKMALFWHDVGASINDAKKRLRESIMLFDDDQSDFNLVAIEKMIDATDHEKPFKGAFLEALVHDIDLAILGDDQCYGLYAWRVMDEYKDKVELKEYAKKRIEVLNGFLNRKRIFETQYFYNRFEITARANIKKEISFWQDAK